LSCLRKRIDNLYGHQDTQENDQPNKTLERNGGNEDQDMKLLRGILEGRIDIPEAFRPDPDQDQDHDKNEDEKS